MALKKLHRRVFLRGLGQTMLALPMLEIMLDSNGERLAIGAEPVPKRLLLTFGGLSPGADGDTRNFVVPTSQGAGYALTEGLKAFGKYGVQGDVSVVSGLLTPAKGPAGRYDSNHPIMHYPQITGSAAPQNGVSKTAGFNHIAADVIGTTTQFKTVDLLAQASFYRKDGSFHARDAISFRKNARGGIEPVYPQNNPQTAFRSLFGNMPSGGKGPSEAEKQELIKRRSVLDLVQGELQALLKNLGTNDKDRMNRHLDEVRDLERRIAALQTTPQAGACTKPTDPGSDFRVTGSYSNEDQRCKIMNELLYMAIACDLTRVGSLVYTTPECFMSVNFLFPGANTDVHELTHNGGSFAGGQGSSMACAKMVGWHVEHYSALLAKLKNTREGNGTLLDNTAALFMLEGGHGYDDSGSKGISAHSTDNMVVLVGGSAGNLKPGRHIVAKGKHPAQVSISAMQAVGVQTNSLGFVDGNIPALF